MSAWRGRAATAFTSPLGLGARRAPQGIGARHVAGSRLPQAAPASSPSAAGIAAAALALTAAAAPGRRSLLAGSQARQRRAGAVRAATTTAEDTANAYLKTKVEEMVALQPVMMFSKTWCPFCAKAKQALQEQGIQAAVLELDKYDEQTQAGIQDILAEVAGARTVPRVFIGGKCIGGGTDTEALAASGELAKLAQSAMESHAKAVRNQESFQLEKSDAEWQQELNREQYYILRNRGTEAPGSHPYDKFLPETGHFSCAGCGLPLYSADSKFASSCGWPVFDKIYTSGDIGQHVRGRPDGSGSLEIVCQRCGSHLGHVFYDAVTDKNLNGERHCANGLSLTYDEGEPEMEGLAEEKLKILQ